LSFLTAPGEVDRVAEQTVGRASATDEVVRHVDLRPNAVETWESEVRYDTPEHDQGQQLPPPESEPSAQDQQGQQGKRRRTGEEEQVVEHRGGGEMVSPEDERLFEPTLLLDRRARFVRSAS